MKINLANLPTPIQKLEELSKDLEVNLFIKRDDLTGLELSGNKIRKLEYSLGDALEEGADTVVTLGAIQSNHCRATAAACARLGLECHLILNGEEPESYEGNLFLDYLLGANIHFIGTDGNRDLNAEKLIESLEKKGKIPYFIPVGASNSVGSLGYIDAVREIIDWEIENNIEFDLVCLAVGSGGTYSGLYYGLKEQKSKADLCGLSVSESREQFTEIIINILRNMGLELSKELKEKIWIDDSYVGGGYGKTTKYELEIIRDLARKEAIILDPTYSGKAFIGLLDKLKKGEFKNYKNILFIHTGGAFGWTKGQRGLLLKKQ